MENSLHLYHTLIQVLRKYGNWLDIRHLKTLVWMMTGLIQSGRISLTAADLHPCHTREQTNDRRHARAQR